MAFITAAIKSLPLILDIISRIKASSDAALARGLGADEAVAAGLRLANAQLAMADEAVAEAKHKQTSHPGSDDGFDNQFRRD